MLLESDYLQALIQVKRTGVLDEDRTGTGTWSIPGISLRLEEIEALTGKIPLPKTKFLHYPSIFHELIWMISGDTNIKYLVDNGVSIWNEWADDNGDLGPVYGKQWRDCDGIDQLQVLVDSMRNNPSSRRMIVDAWNVRDLDKMALTPCHMTFQVCSKPATERERIEFMRARPDDYMTLEEVPTRISHVILTQRSSDMFLGLPFNMVFYYVLNCMLCHITDHIPGSIKYNLGDAHVYTNHAEQVEKQFARLEELKGDLSMPTYFAIPRDCPAKEIDDFTYEMLDSALKDYRGFCMSSIKAPVSV